MKKVSLAIVVVLMIFLSFWAGRHFDSSTSSGAETPGERQILYYADPMNPGFRSEEPGIAPCGMPLEPVYAETNGGSVPAGSPGAVSVNADRRQLIGLKTATVSPQPLTYNLRLYGKVVPDETRVFKLNASTDSWIRELSDATTGSFVDQGQILAEALAPAYYNAQVTYLITLDNVDRIKEQLGGQLRHQQGDLANNQMRVAVQALQNLGISDEQVEDLARTRKARPYLEVRSPTTGFILNRDITLKQWFKAAEQFYTIADLKKVWIYCDVYEHEARHLYPGMAVSVKHAQLGKSFAATISEVLPLFDPVSKTLKVRIDVENLRFDLRPDMFVDVEIPITMPSSMHVSADAIIETGTQSVVYVDSGDGIVEPRKVETGWRLGRRVEIKRGLMPGEKIVVSGNFLIDSESRMKTAASGYDIPTSQDPVCGMDVPEQAAMDSDRMVQHDNRHYFFCTQDCKLKFLTEIDRYTMDMAHEPERPVPASGAQPTIDPVCGMSVDEMKAEYEGWHVKLDGEPYHFCSQQCIKSFLMNPKKFIADQPKKTEENKSPEPTMGHGEIAQDHESHSMPMNKKASAEQGSVAESEPEVPQVAHNENAWSNPKAKTMQIRTKHVNVIDWDGEDKDVTEDSPEDWKGWGKFPGAEYLGLKDRKSAYSSTAEKSAAQDQPREHHDGMEHQDMKSDQ